MVMISVRREEHLPHHLRYRNLSPMHAPGLNGLVKPRYSPTPLIRDAGLSESAQMLYTCPREASLDINDLAVYS